MKKKTEKKKKKVKSCLGQGKGQSRPILNTFGNFRGHSKTQKFAGKKNLKITGKKEKKNKKRKKKKNTNRIREKRGIWGLIFVPLEEGASVKVP